MAAVVSGSSLGVVNTSLHVSGQSVLGPSSQGRAGERVYLNAATGNLVIQGQDEILIGRGPDATVLRTYNSQGLLDDDNGDNWRLGFYRRVYALSGTANSAGSTVKRVDADGAEALYTYDAARGKYVTSEGAGAFDTLAFDATAQVWTFTDGDTQVTERYDAANGGRLVQVVDESGNTVSFAYTGALLTAVQTANGESTFLDYTGNNLTQVRTVAAGTTLVRTRYAYDASNRLTQVITDLSPQDAAVADDKTYVTSYTYDGTSRRVASMTQSDGTSLAFTYAQIGADWRVASMTDALARVTSFAYNTTARTTAVTDPLGRSTVLAYDAVSRLTGVTMPATAGAAAQSLAYAYDASGNVTSVTDARGSAVVYQYDANGNRVLERDAAGNTVTRVYGAKNELLAETQYKVVDPDGPGAGQASGALTTRYVYDANTRVRFAVSAAGRVTEYRYNGFGQRIASIEYTGATYDITGLTPSSTLTEAQLVAWLPADRSKSIRVDTAYDFRGQVAALTTYAAVDSTGNGVSATQSVTRFVYDMAGNLLQTVDGRGGAAAYVYDGLGRVLASTDALGRATLTDYQDASRKTVITFANGLVRTLTYSAAGELVSVLESASNISLGETKYFYDANGHLARTQDPTGVTTRCFYDEAGRKVGEIDGDGSLTEYRYDANNNLTRTIRYATAVSAVAEGATLASIRPLANGADRSTWNAYDAANRLVKSVDEAGFVTQRFYDGAGRLTDVLRYAAAISIATLGDAPQAGSINPVASSDDRLTRSFYDADGKLAGTLDGEGYLVEYRYDAAGQLAETIGYATATNAGLRSSGTLAQLLPAASAADIHSYTFYNARGEVAAVVDGEGFLTENVYDAAGKKTQGIRYGTRVNYTAGATLAGLRPAANPQDQVTSTSYTALNQVASKTDIDGTVAQYSYDEVGNLILTVKAANTAEARTLLAQYDKHGRLTAQLSANGAAQLDGNQTQAQIDAIWAANAIKHTYDAAGRRTSSTDALGNKTLFYYNADGELTHTINAQGEVTETVYNVLGQKTQTIRYGAQQLSAATLATLSGGLVDGTLTTALAGFANDDLDSRTSYAYTTRGLLAQSTDALGNAVTQAFNAFGEVVGKSQALGGGVTIDHVYSYDKRGLLARTVWDPSGLNTSAATVYDAFGRAVQSTDVNGNVRTASYDKLGQVVTTRDPLNALRSSSYDAFGRVLTQTDALGQSTTFAYDTANRSVTVTTPEGIAVTTVRNRHGEKVSVTDGRGNTTTYQYDRNGNLTAVTTPAAGTVTSSYDRADRLIETVDARGVKTSYAYEASGRVFSRVVDPGGLALTTTYVYDAKGQVVGVVDPNGVQTLTVYDGKGQVVSVIVDPNGLRLETIYAYDGAGRKLTVTEGVGTPQARVTAYAYDKLGRLLSERVDPSGLNITTSYAYDKNNNVVAKTDANGNVTRYVYDANDRLVYTVDPLGGVTRMDYDAEGRTSRFTAYAGPIGLAGLAPAPTLADVAARITAGAADFTKSYVYDADGRELFCIDALGAITEKTYDANGNVVRKILYATPIPAGTPLTAAAVRVALAVSAQDEVTRTVYDAADRAVFVVDALGQVQETVYDAAGNVTATIAYANAVALTGASLTETAVRAAFGGPTYVEAAKEDVSLPVTETAQITVDNNASTTRNTGFALQTWNNLLYPSGTGTDWNYQGDFNGDGKTDIASWDTANTVRIQLSTGNGFNAQIWNAQLYGAAAGWNFVGDYNGDGKSDIASWDTAGTLRVYLSTGTGFAAQTWISQIYGAAAGWNFVGDYNGDGKSDIAAWDTAGTLRMNLSTGSGFTSQIWSSQIYGGPAAGWNFVGDYNGDGKSDIAAWDTAGTLRMNLSTGSGFTSQIWSSQINGGPAAGWNFVGDYNGDGKSDIAAWDTAGTLRMNLSTGTGFTSQVWSSQLYGAVVGWNFVGDYNGDGKSDIASWDSSTALRMNIGRVSPVLAWTAAIQPAGTTASFRYRAAGGAGAFTSITVSSAGGESRADVGPILAGNYEFQIDYRDSFGRILKSTGGVFGAAARGVIVSSAAFGSTRVVSTSAAGSAIRGYIDLAEMAAIDHVSAEVRDANTNALVGSALTYPEFEANYAGEVNLKVGAPLAAGNYRVAVVVHYKDGRVVNRPAFGIGPRTPGGGLKVLLYPDDARVVRRVYDAADRLVYAIDGEGYVTETRYDNLGRIARTIRYAQRVDVGARPTITDIATALAPESVTASAVNRTDTLFANPVQPNYPYAASARNDVAAPATQTVNVTSTSQPGSRPPNQPDYTYVASAKNDVASPATQSPSLDFRVLSSEVGIIEWWAGVQPPGTTVSCLYRPGGLNYASASLSMSGDRQQARCQITRGWERVEYLIEYRDAWGRVVKSASGAVPINWSTLQTNGQGTFQYTAVTSTPTAGSSIRGYVPLSQVSLIDRVTATVTDATTGAVVTSNVLTYPEYESGYNGEVNLKVGSELATGRYSVAIKFFYKEGTADNRQVFLYEVGPQSDGVIQQTLSWAAGTAPGGTTPAFKYRPAGSTGSYTSVPVTLSGANHQVVIAAIAAGSYEYIVEYRDAYNRVLKSAASTFTVSASGSATTATTFSFTQVTSTAAAGSSIAGYITAAEVPAIDFVDATVRDLAGNVVSSARTYPEFEPAYNGNVNLKVGSPLADGKYNVTVSIRKKDGTTQTRAPFYYEVGAQPVLQRTTTVSWGIPAGVAGATVQFSYARSGSTSLVGALVATAGSSHQVALTDLADGQYTYFVCYYNGAGQLVKEASDVFTAAATGSEAGRISFWASLAQDPNRLKQVNTFTYDAAGRLVQSADPLGFSESYGYDALGNRTAFTNKKGAVWTYAYDRAGRLVDEFSPAVTVGSEPGAVLRTRLQYDALGNVVARTEAFGRPEARTTRYEYDARGRQVRTVFPTVNVYNAAADNLAANSGTIQRVETAVSLSAEVAYDALGRAVVNRAADGTYSYKAYDALGRLRYDIDAERFVSEYRYDAFGNRTAIIRRAQRLDFGAHASGAAWTVAQVDAALGASVQDRRIDTLYDRNNRGVELLEPQAYVFDAAGNRGTTAGRRTLSEYNAFDEVVRRRSLSGIDAQGNPVWADTYSYFDRRGERVAQIDAEGYLSEWTYDASGNVVRQVEYARRSAPGSWSASAYARPPVGDADSGYDRTTAYAYDLADRRISETRVGVHYSALAGSTSLVDARGDVTTTFGYDAVGNLVSTIDAEGAATFVYYDALGRTTAIAAPARQTTDPARGGAAVRPLTIFALDAFGKTVRQTSFANGAVSASAAGFSAGAASAADQVSTLVYDAHGNIVQSIDAEGASQYFSYDAAGRVAKSWRPISLYWPGGPGNLTQYRIENFQYDGLGNQVATLDSSTRFNYLNSTNSPYGVLSEERAAYNAFGEIVSKTVNDVPTEYFDYDNAGHLWRTNQKDGVDKVYLYDVQGRGSAEIRSLGADLRAYAGAAAADGATRAAGSAARSETQYDRLGRVVRSELPMDGRGFLPVIDQTFDRWGNVISVVDPRIATAANPNLVEWQTLYRYDEQNRLVVETKPFVIIQDEDGTSRWHQPVTRNFYDRLGRAIGTQDANAADADRNGNGVYENATTARYNAGGQLARQINPDGGVVDVAYDALGRKVGEWDARGYFTASAYDREDRLVRVTRPDGTTEQYQYNELGNRILETNALGRSTGYAYDAHGRVIRRTLPNNQTTWTYYDKVGNKRYELNAENESQAWDYDAFGRVTRYVDLGGVDNTNTYNRLGLLASATNGRSGITYTYDANGALRRIDNLMQNPTNANDWWLQITEYDYDVAGNRVHERFVKNGSAYMDNAVTYDALNRAVDVSDIRYHLVYTYDANGNRRHTDAGFASPKLGWTSRQYWYRYDRMNRITVSQGELSGGSIVLGSQGTELAYDAAGNRVRASGTFTSPSAGGKIDRFGATETYQYDAQGRLVQTNRNGVISSSRVYDAAGNVTALYTFDTSGHLESFQTYQYDPNGWLTQQASYKYVSLFVPGNTGGVLFETYAPTSIVNYTDRDQLGQITRYEVKVYNPNWNNTSWSEPGDESTPPVIHPDAQLSDGYQYTNTYSYSYLKFGGESKEFQVFGSSTSFQSGRNTTHYDSNGNVLEIENQFDGNQHRRFIVDQSGRVLQNTQNLSTGEETEYYFYANDRPLGATGFGDKFDFDFNYTPVSDDYPVIAPSSYVVAAGDTLRSIAQAMFGDSALWYLIADANGLAADAELMIGMSLTIPNRITNLRNTYETFKPYEPSKIIGDTTPKLPEPPPPPKSKGKCGGFGKILVAAVSIVVAIVLPFVAPAVFGIGAGLLGAVATAVASNLAGQVVANIVGLQDGFNFASVAVSALTAGISFGVLGVPGAVSTASGLTELGAPIGPVGRAVAGNLINQGVSIALGQQKAFSWAAVAGAAVSAGVTQVVSGGDLLGSTTASPNPLATLAGNLAGGVVRAALSGGKVNFVDIAADAFGNALGTAIGQSITQNMGQQRQQLQNAYAQATHEEMAAEPEPVPMPPTRPDPWKTGSAPVEFMDYVGSTGAIAQRAAEIQDPSGRAPSAVRGAESFDLEGLARVAEGVEQSQEPRIILAANSVVHYDLVGLIASKFSLERARVQEIMNYSQWPDQVGLLDAPTQGYRNVTPMSSDQTSIGKLYAESLHALNGMSPTETIGFALQMIKDNPSDNAIAGMALHPLVDATFHSYRDSAGRLVTYTAPIGHFFDGHEPDYVTPLKVTVATESLITAFEYISGKQLDNAGRQEIHDLVNDRMNRATQLGGLTLPPTTLEDGTIQLEPRPSEEMDRSFRQAIRELFRGQLQPEDTPLRIPVDRGSVTYGTTLRETATYLGKTLEEAVPFVDNGLRAAAYIANRYVDRYNPAYFGGYLDPTNRMGFDPGPRGRSR